MLIGRLRRYVLGMFDGFDLLFTPREAVELKGITRCTHPNIQWIKSDRIPSNGFSLRWDDKGVKIEFSDYVGEIYARQLWNGIKPGIMANAAFPAFECRDWPDFKRRGFMLDISRTRVPTMPWLFRWVNLLAALRYNELQLYSEHTFAYRGRELVWGSASPMTPEELQVLDRYCRERGIELVPNQNCFGHMERWLRHPDFHELAECPNGFIHPHGGLRSHGSVLKPNAESLEFVRGLLAELLPNFSSCLVNIGCDEAWELGQGYSRERAEREGRAVVYREFVEQLTTTVVAMGKRPQIWADELMRDTLAKHNFPAETIPMIWGYEAGHPFKEHCQRVRRAGFNEFYVVPGTACWNSASGNLDKAMKNIAEAAEQGMANGATGLLLTSWGDGGHQYPPEMMLAATVFAGSMAWSTGMRPAAGSLAIGISQAAGVELATAEALIEIGLWEAEHIPPIFNASRVFKVCLATGEREIAKWVCAEDKVQWENAQASIRSALTRWEKLPSGDPKNALIWAARMNLWGVERAMRFLRKSPPTPESRNQWAGLMCDYQYLWHRDSRPGGYVESQQTLQCVQDAEGAAANPTLFQRDYRIHGYEAGALGTMKFATILNHFQDIAESHASQLGVSIEHIKPKGWMWVLARYHVRLSRLPNSGEAICIRTWPSGWERLFANREFEIIDEQGHLCGVAASAWLVLQEGNFRPLKAGDCFPGIPVHAQRTVVSEWQKLPSIERVDSSKQFTVLHHDLDINGHVNNTQYAIWALESAPSEIWENYRPFELEIHFQAMAFSGDTVNAETMVCERSDEGEPVELIHQLYRASDHLPLTRLRSRWALPGDGGKTA